MNYNPAPSKVTFERNIYYDVPDAASYTWTSSYNTDPLIDLNTNNYRFEPRSNSPANNAGIDGLDIGALFNFGIKLKDY